MSSDLRRRLGACAVGLACALSSGLAAAQERVRHSDIELPQLGEPADTTLSPQEEYTIGARITAQIHAEGFALEDPELLDHLWRVGWRVASHAQGNLPPLTFFLVRDPRINAFALPGGFMGFNAGLIMAADNESELAGVVAHELAHVTQRHIARTIAGTRAADLATWAAVLAAIIAGSANPDVIIGALSLGQAASLQRQINFTRAHELEADRIGIRTMSDAGYNPQAMISFFQRLEQQSRLYGSGLPEILRTHPVNSQRIAEARARAEAMDNSRAGQAERPLEFDLMRARARVLSAERPSVALDYFSRRIDSGLEHPAEFYGAALAQYELGNFGRAAEWLERAMEDNAEQRNLLLLAARNAHAQGDSEGAFGVLDMALSEHPRYAPLLLTRAEVLMDAGQAAAARQYLLDNFDKIEEFSVAHQILARAARQNNDRAEFAYHSAVYAWRRGDAVTAITHLDAGLRHETLSESERARLSSLRREVRRGLPDNWRPSQEISRDSSRSAFP